MSKKLSLDEILNNTPEELNIEGYGIVLVKAPTNIEKLDAKREAKRLTEGLSEDDMLTEYSRILASKMLVEPKISIKDYMESNDATLSIILDTVSLWYTAKITELNDPRKEQINSFLQIIKGSSQKKEQ